MATLLPPPPTGQGLSFEWQDWYLKLHRFLTTTDTILWANIDKAGSSLADLAIRRHNDLQNIQGGTASEYYHLTNSDYTKVTTLPATFVSSVNTKTGAAVLTTSDIAEGTNLYYTDARALAAVVSTGTFTPTLVSTGGGVPTYTTQYGSYTKVNKRVLFTIRVQISAVGTLAAGNITINSLPFSSANVTGNITALDITANALAAGATTQIMASLSTNSSSISLFRYAAGATTALAVADLTATSVFNISGSYDSP